MRSRTNILEQPHREETTLSRIDDDTNTANIDHTSTEGCYMIGIRIFQNLIATITNDFAKKNVIIKTNLKTYLIRLKLETKTN